jgi:hypothetical protein
MEIIDYVSDIIKLTKEDAIKYSKKIDGDLTYYWNPIRGGRSLICDEKGNFLSAGSSYHFDMLLEEYKKGEKVKNFFNK